MRLARLAAAMLAAGLIGSGFGCWGSRSSADERMNAALPEVGVALPAVSGVTLDGSKVTNEAFAGKTVLLNTWFFN